MKRLILVVGRSGQGKSYLARFLSFGHSFAALSVDEVYLDFVRTHCPMLYFDALNLYISPHYHAILKNRDHSMTHLGRDFVHEWLRYLATKILGLISLHDNVVVEGCLLDHCANEFQSAMASFGQVFVVSVVKQRYFLNDHELSMESVATLGLGMQEGV
ncbi:hypothetical protein SAMN05421863_101140 [Nitrosomonas communis]|uniref:AAA domain-containing protein n=2 Tax=Nitrosomonas communis TaxID=44574 RepID=A0A1I4MQJ7_9PROT|nr:hypothetical protein SAMN05421863_101140 [Nitrosomonas communis]